MKKIKAWAVLHKGKLTKVGCHVLLADCPFAIYDNSKPLEGKTTPCEITITLPSKKKK